MAGVTRVEKKNMYELPAASTSNTGCRQYLLPAPQIRGVRAAGASNTRCTSCLRLKYAVYELPAPQIRGVRAAGASNTRCTSCRRLKYAMHESPAPRISKYAGASNTRCTSRCQRLLTVKLWRRQLVHRVFDHHQ